MLSYQIVEFGKPLKAAKLEAPKPERTQVLLKVAGCGVCHTDIHIWDGYFDLGGGERINVIDRGMPMPFTMGHEVVGSVVAVGPGAEGVRVGDKRIVYPWVGCGECKTCLSGAENLCTTQRFIGTRVHGGYSDHVLVPHPRYLVEYSGVDDATAGTYACSGLTAFAALKKVAYATAEDHVLVIGAGGVGLSAVHLAPTVTRAGIIVADINPAKRAAALQAGARHAVDAADKDAVARIKGELSPGGAAAVIDFVGAPATAKLGLDALRNGGTLVIVGLYGGRLALPLALLPFRNHTIRGSFVGSIPDLRELMGLVAAGKVPPLAIEKRPLSEATRTLGDLKGGCVMGRVVLVP